MTTIAYRDGVLAGDTLSTKDGMRAGNVVKVRRCGDSIVGMMGLAPDACALAAWLEAGKVGDQPDNNGALIELRADGSLHIYENGGCQEAGDAPFHAWGAGAPIAVGAMAHGATAEEAIRYAIEWDTLTGGDVTALRATECPTV